MKVFPQTLSQYIISGIFDTLFVTSLVLIIFEILILMLHVLCNTRKIRLE